MNCDDVKREIPLYGYGELNPEIEERIEAHLRICAECSIELERHRELMEALDDRPQVIDGTLLADCRAELRRQLEAESTVSGTASRWGAFLRKLHAFSEFHVPLRIPAGALALVALGWFAARYAPAKFGGIEAGVVPQQPMFSTVKSVEPDSSGGVQIAVDEIQRRVVSGGLDDPRIRALLLNAAREESNPDLRVESIGILRNSSDSQAVRQALMDAVAHDPDSGVRLKALDGLKPYAGDPLVRQTLANALLKDDDPKVRIEAIDVLTKQHDDSIVGVLQDVVQKEDNSYVRARCRDLLEAMNASVGTY
jgi:hypothetical protein